MNEQVKQAVKKHALKEAPYECVGFVVSDNLGNVSVLECENIHRNKRNKFSTSMEDWQKAHSYPHVLAFYHSHCDDFLRESTEKFSTQDILMCNECEIPFLLYAYPNDAWNYIEPKDYKPISLEKRPYIKGYWDCYTLVRDYYRIHYNHIFNYYFFPDGENRENIIHENAISEAEGVLKLVSFKELRRGDIICFKVLGSKKMNHFGIYLNDNIFLHQLSGSFSQASLLNEKWINRIERIYRYG